MQGQIQTNAPSIGGLVVLFLNAVALASAAVAVILRLWSRRLKQSRLRLNDVAIIIALVFQLGQSIAIIGGVILSKAGYHQKDLSPADVVLMRKMILITVPLWVTANSFVKLSILHLYMVLFPVTWLRKSIYAVMIVVLAYWMAIVVCLLFSCFPFAYSWDKNIYDGFCVDQWAECMGFLIANLLLDLAVIILPLHTVWQIRMPKAKKIMVSAIFGFGSLICLITILRIISLASFDSADLTYSVVPEAIWSDLETCLGIVNACLPVLGSVVDQVKPSSSFNWDSQPLRSGPWSPIQRRFPQQSKAAVPYDTSKPLPKTPKAWVGTAQFV